MSPLIGLSSSYIQSVLGAAFQSSNATAKSTAGGAGASSTATQTDQGQLSPFATIMSELQQAQASDPARFQQVTQQISTSLQSASQTAQANGNSQLASQLNQLSTDFKNSSQDGQLPSAQDLAQSIGGHRHHHHSHAASGAADSASNAGVNGTNQLLSAFQASAPPVDSLDPASIIMNTLASAGLGGSTNQ